MVTAQAFAIASSRLSDIASGGDGAAHLESLRDGGYDVCDWPAGSVVLGPCQITDDYRSQSWPLGMVKSPYRRRRGHAYVG